MITRTGWRGFLARWVRLRGAAVGAALVGLMLVACLGSLPWTLGTRVLPDGTRVARSNDGEIAGARLPPGWWPVREDQRRRIDAARDAIGKRPGVLAGTDALGRSVSIRLLAGGAISLVIGLLAACVAVVIGTAYGAIAGLAGGRIDAIMMRIVDILYGIPYILLVVLLGVASDAAVDGLVASRARSASAHADAFIAREIEREPMLAQESSELDALRARARARYGSGEIAPGTRQAIAIVTLLAAIGGVSWLTLARVVRGQVLSLKARSFFEAARAIGASRRRLFFRHLLPNLVGPIVVYATLAVPQAMLQESFLSFLGIGVRPPMPSWGTLVADGLAEINPADVSRSSWWMLVFPCAALTLTLVALNLLGEGVRQALDPKSRER